MASTLGTRIKVTLFGQSHGPAIGVVIDGLPAGEAVDMEALQAFLRRRAPGQSPLQTGRAEGDVPRILSGIVDGVTCGAPLCAVIDNTDARPEAYAALADVLRPGHADFPARMRDGGCADLRGGGHFSGRLTAPLCVAGGIALQLLARRGITVGAHIAAIGSMQDMPFDPAAVIAADLLPIAERNFPVRDETAGEAMRKHIAEVQATGDSIGGLITCYALGLPAGLGQPIFDGVENRVAQAVFGIPGVRGVSFGAGFDAAAMQGSEHNDAYVVRGDAIVTETNRHGGVLGGMTTGMPLQVHVAIKPTPSIAKPQQTVRLSTHQPETLSIEGRHDACIVPRAVPCVEATVAITLLDLLLEGGTGHGYANPSAGD